MKLILKKDNGTVLTKEFTGTDIDSAKALGWKEDKPKPKKTKIKKKK
jgi:hypothetical protein